MIFLRYNLKNYLPFATAFVFSFAFIFMASGAFAGAVLESGIPVIGAKGAQNAPLPDLGTYINYLYIFVLGFVGIAGFISLIIWGTVWVASGIVDKKAMALEKIKSVFIGIAIALSAYIMLSTINPDLTIIKIPTTKTAELKLNSSQMTFLAQQAKHSVSDGSKCQGSLQCLIGSTCEGMADVMPGTCVRVAGICSEYDATKKETCEEIGTGAGGGAHCVWCQTGPGYRCVSSCI